MARTAGDALHIAEMRETQLTMREQKGVLMRAKRAMRKAVQRGTALGRSVAGLRRTTIDDPNFIGFDKYRKHGAYHWTEIQRSPEYKEKVDLLRHLVKAGDRVLDLGCGDAAYVAEVAAKAHFVVGIDADYDAIRVARRMLKKSGTNNARCEQMTLAQFKNLASGDYDVVYSMDVIEHLPDPSELLDVAMRAAKPGALIVIGTPLFISAELVSPYHVKEFTEEEIRAIIQPSLEIVEEYRTATKRPDGANYPETFYFAACRKR